jgi:hypothetical protein
VPDQPGASPRPWREIAAEITREKDSNKMAVLLIELNRPLDQQLLKKQKPAQGKSTAEST